MAGPSTATNGQIQKSNGNGAAVAKKGEGGIVGLLQAMGPEIARALPRHLTPDRMARVCLTALRVNPKLNDCSPASFMAAIMAAASLGLEPNTPLGHAYLIPYGNTCQLILGYRGLMDLALRSGRVTSIKAVVVRKGDTFEFEQGLHDKLVHRPCGDDAAPVTHVYAIARIRDADPVFTVLSKPQIERRRMRGASGKGIKTPWDTDWDAMALKTAVRALIPWVPMSAEMATANHLENMHERGTPISYALPEIAESLQGAGLREEPIEVAEVVDPDAPPSDEEIRRNQAG
jgi:recombination protein RecT